MARPLLYPLRMNTNTKLGEKRVSGIITNKVS